MYCPWGGLNPRTGADDLQQSLFISSTSQSTQITSKYSNTKEEKTSSLGDWEIVYHISRISCDGVVNINIFNLLLGQFQPLITPNLELPGDRSDNTMTRTCVFLGPATNTEIETLHTRDPTA